MRSYAVNNVGLSYDDRMSEAIETNGSETPLLKAAIVFTIVKFLIGSIRDFSGAVVTLREVDEREAAKQLIRLGQRYAGEMSSNDEGDQMLAMTVMACSLMETLLMLACICYKHSVTSSKAWRKNRRAKKGRSFLDTLNNTELTTLIAVAEELQWFSTDIPEEFRNAVSPEEFESVMATVPKGLLPSEAAAKLAREARNRLHPGYCLREKIDLSDSKLLTEVWLSRVWRLPAF